MVVIADRRWLIRKVRQQARTAWDGAAASTTTPRACRSANRINYSPGVRAVSIGFRLLRQA